MSEKTIIERIQSIIRDVFGDDSIIIDRSTNTSEVPGWDSITHISILEAIQDEFCINLTLDEMIELTDIQSIINKIIEKKG